MKNENENKLSNTETAILKDNWIIKYVQDLVFYSFFKCFLKFATQIISLTQKIWARKPFSTVLW